MTGLEPRCTMWWDSPDDLCLITLTADHACFRAPSFHLRHVCTCGAEMIEDVE